MTLLTLEQWRAQFGMHPWHFFQLSNATVPLNAQCPTLTYQDAWQRADQVGRLQITQAIAYAEARFRQQLGYPLAPTFCEATITYPRPGDKRMEWLRRAGGLDNRWLPLQAPDSRIIGAGVAAESTPTTVSVAYTDEDGDGLSETATVIATVPAGSAPAELVARFLAADCGPVTPPEVRPRSATVVGTTATLVFNAWELVRPVRYQGASVAPLDPGLLPPLLASPFASQLSVFRRYLDPTGETQATAQAVMVWETRPWPAWACCDDGASGSSRDPAAEAYALARVVVRDGPAGLLAAGEARRADGQWVAVDWSTCRQPDRITLRYQAGLPLDGLAMPSDRQTVVARLSAAELTRPVCACVASNKELYEWQTDLSRTGTGGVDLFASPDDLTNPFGARRGQVYAWRWAQQTMAVSGIYAG
jgi:hypothetical protein